MTHPTVTRPTSRAVAALALLLPATLLAGCGSKASTGDKGYVSGEGIVKEYHGSDRKKLPAISGTTLTGTKVTVTGLAAGRPTVLNVWGAWCADCRKEAPTLTAAANQLGDKASFVGIDVRDSSRDNPLAFQRTFGITYPSVYDPDGRSLLGLPKSVPAYAVPSTIVVDAKGRITATILGAVPSALTIEQLVQAAS